jgi:hypothetical protein
MGFPEMVVAIVLIGCASEVLKSFAKRSAKADKGLRDELRTLREEVERLRRHGNDSILSFDATLQRLDQRLTSVETRVALPAGTSDQEVETLRHR